MVISISILIPAYNEEGCIEKQVAECLDFFDKKKLNGEVIAINDGSTDSTATILKKLEKRDKRIKVLSHKRNFGKSAALNLGFENASGDLVVLLDADLQYDVNEITKMIKKIREGYDIVTGWRKNRKDDIFRNTSSWIYNSLINFIFGLDVHDSNSGMKCMRREVIETIVLAAEEHRYILPLAKRRGFKISEVVVTHYPRKLGKSKYGTFRLFVGFLDMLTLKLHFAFSNKPMLLFGTSGLLLLLLGFLTGLYLVYTKFVYGVSIGTRPLFFASILFLLMGLNIFFVGIVADFQSRINNKVEKLIQERKND
ncbi:glycosyltransferase family 2 protein [Candidatus Undinarchaeota archaeon]